MPPWPFQNGTDRPTQTCEKQANQSTSAESEGLKDASRGTEKVRWANRSKPNQRCGGVDATELHRGQGYQHVRRGRCIGAPEAMRGGTTSDAWGHRTQGVRHRVTGGDV